jgi:hypothetical protein
MTNYPVTYKYLINGTNRQSTYKTIDEALNRAAVDFETAFASPTEILYEDAVAFHREDIMSYWARNVDKFEKYDMDWRL